MEVGARAVAEGGGNVTDDRRDGAPVPGKGAIGRDVEELSCFWVWFEGD